MSPEWITAIGTGLGVLTATLASLWQFSKAVDRNTQATKSISQSVEKQWAKIDRHADLLDDHEGRIIRVETKLDNLKN